MTTETYEDIIRAYYRNKDNEDWFFNYSTGRVVITGIEDEECDIYENAQQCFEQSVKPDIEESYSEDDLFDFSIFTSKQLDFMAKTYPNTNLAAQIAKYNEKPDLTVSLTDFNFSIFGNLWARAHVAGENFLVCYSLNDSELDSFHLNEHLPKLLKPYKDEIWDRCDSAMSAAFEDKIESTIERHLSNLNKTISTITIQ